jgi:squalene synthase HpnC
MQQENFIVLSVLVPKALADDYAAIYAFCRAADDIADERFEGESPAEGNARALAELRVFRQGLDWALSAQDESQAPAGLSESRRLILQIVADTIAHRNLSREPFDWLLDAFEQDQAVTRYQNWSQLLAYCARSADPVGRLVLALHGYGDASMTPGHDDESRRRFAASDAICTGLQLANFWQDVRRDLLERDRVYIPSDDTGIRAEDLRAWLNASSDAHIRQQYAAALRSLVERSWSCFAAGKPLSTLVDRRTAWSTWLFRRAGEVVLRRLEQQNFTSLWERVTVPKSTRAALLLQAIGGYILHRRPRGT